MNLYEILYFIQGNSLIALLMALSLSLYFQNRSSFIIGVTVVACCNFLHIVFNLLMLKLFESPYYEGVIGEVAVRGWYVFYAVTDLFAVFMIYFLNMKVKLKPTMHCHIVALILVALALFQVVQYIGRFILESNVFGNIYSISIPFLNSFMLIFIISGLFLETKNAIRKREL